MESIPSVPATEPLRAEEPRRLAKRGLMALLVVVLVLNMGLTGYVFYTGSVQTKALQGQVTQLSSSLQSVSSALAEANAKLATLGSTSTGGSPSSGLDAIVIYESVKDSVVLIQARVTLGSVQGSGFVYDTTGRIVTNNHVVEGAIAGSINVTFLDGTTLPATVVGTDPYSDLAVIDVDAPASLLKPLTIGSSSALRVGEPVLAIGNPYGLADTLTQGIVSALGREMDSGSGYMIVDVIQTDAPINPGNSGGPLLNSAGEVVGINTATVSGSSNGIGFAVSSDTVAREVPSLILKGTYDQPYVGISGTDVIPGLISTMGLPSGTHGTLVMTVASGGPAEKAGVKGGTRTVVVDGAQTRVGGDVITGADGSTLKTFYDLLVYVQRNKHPGDTITLNILRNGSTVDVLVVLGVRPAP